MVWFKIFKMPTLLLIASLSTSGCAVGLATTALYSAHYVNEASKIPRFTTRINGTTVRVITFNNDCSFRSLSDKNAGKPVYCGLLKFPAGSSFSRQQQLTFAKQLIASEPRIDWPRGAEKALQRYNKKDPKDFHFPYIPMDIPPQWQQL